MSSQGYSNVNGQWIREGVNGTEIADTSQIRNAILQRLYDDKELGEYYKQQSGFGFLTPDQIINKYENAADIYANKYGYKKTTSKVETKANPYALEEVNTQNQIRVQNNGHANDMKKLAATWRREDNQALAGPVIEANVRTAEQLDLLNQDWSNAIVTLADDIGAKPMSNDGKIRPSDIRARLSALARTATTDTQRKMIAQKQQQLAGINSTYNTGKIDASWTGFARVFNTDVAVNAKKQVNEYLKDPRAIYGKTMQLSLIHI